MDEIKDESFGPEDSNDVVNVGCTVCRASNMELQSHNYKYANVVMLFRAFNC